MGPQTVLVLSEPEARWHDYKSSLLIQELSEQCPLILSTPAYPPHHPNTQHLQSCRLPKPKLLQLEARREWATLELELALTTCIFESRHSYTNDLLVAGAGGA